MYDDDVYLSMGYKYLHDDDHLSMGCKDTCMMTRSYPWGKKNTCMMMIFYPWGEITHLHDVSMG